MAWALAPPDPVVLAGMLPQENIQNTQNGTSRVRFSSFQKFRRKSSLLSSSVTETFFQG